MGNLENSKFLGNSSEPHNIFVTKSVGNSFSQSLDTSAFPLLPNILIDYKFSNAQHSVDVRGGKITFKFPKVNEILTSYCNECLRTYTTIEFIELVNQQSFPANLFSYKNEKLEYAISLYNKIFNLPLTSNPAETTLSFYLNDSTSLIFNTSPDTAAKLANLKNSLKSIEAKYLDRLIQEVSPNTVQNLKDKPLDAATVNWFNSQKGGKVLDKKAADWFIKRANEEMELDIKVIFAKNQVKAVMFNADPIISDPRFRMSLEDSRWNDYDETIKDEVAYYNKKFSGTNGFVPLDWRLVKAMVWTEVMAGPKGNAKQWTTFPMQIGRFAEDAGYKVVSQGLDNSDLITSSEFRREIQDKNKIVGNANVKTGIAYLYTKAIDGKVSWREVIDDVQIQSDAIQARDNGLENVSKRLGTTIDNIIKNTPGMSRTSILQPNQEIKYQKAHLERYISGWSDWNTAMRNYNSKTPDVKGDVKYTDKYNRAYQIIVSRSVK